MACRLSSSCECDADKSEIERCLKKVSNYLDSPDSIVGFYWWHYFGLRNRFASEVF